ncbi:MAG: hypothetical protein EBR33_13370 [Synechococcaceae bacterium WB4_1_0192]|nr:hypothetical protein [Synechococcaceae bacterium WB4_1_0192]
MPPDDVSHRDIYVRLAELGAKVDALLQLMAERKEDVARITRDVDQLFTRQRVLENRMAQVAILGIVAAVLIPAIATMVDLRLSTPVPIEHQEQRQ